ncbi:MAG: cupin domain-containing protein [Chloroflexota bacterium]|nr:cupin domain-containing protein [Chloroflexota bacterium]MED5450481.1 cupin domain-containing protein [Chloroflexota bacterium]|tara:strand:- start:172 stop:639 length:468 start_codon:yes stop_codon:yes gene_type:complete
MSFSNNPLVLGPNEGKLLQISDHPLTFKASKNQTNGAYSLFEANLIGGGPGQHVHSDEDEAIYVLEGDLNVKLGDDIFLAKPGSFIFLPRNIVHTFWKANEKPVKILVIISPPEFEEFFFDIVGDEQEIDGEKFGKRAMEISDSYNVEFVGPPLG